MVNISLNKLTPSVRTRRKPDIIRLQPWSHIITRTSNVGRFNFVTWLIYFGITTCGVIKVCNRLSLAYLIAWSQVIYSPMHCLTGTWFGCSHSHGRSFCVNLNVSTHHICHHSFEILEWCKRPIKIYDIILIISFSHLLLGHENFFCLASYKLKKSLEMTQLLNIIEINDGYCVRYQLKISQLRFQIHRRKEVTLFLLFDHCSLEMRLSWFFLICHYFRKSWSSNHIFCLIY